MSVATARLGSAPVWPLCSTWYETTNSFPRKRRKRFGFDSPAGNLTVYAADGLRFSVPACQARSIWRSRAG